jgi:hypothetical protein
MEIIKSNDIYSVDSISMYDIIYGKAMLNRVTTTGTVINISSIFISTPQDQSLDLEKFNEEFQGGEAIDTPQELVKFISKLKGSFVYPLDRLDNFLTHYVNLYLNNIFKSGYTIESVFTDLEDLFSIDEVVNAPGMKRMIKFFSKLFSTNYSNRERLKEILGEEKEVDETFNRVIYPIPVLIINPVCGLIGFSKVNESEPSLLSFRRFLDNNEITKVVCQNDSFFSILEDIRKASKEFDELGYITLVHRTLDDMRYGLIVNKVYHRDNGTYLLER